MKVKEKKKGVGGECLLTSESWGNRLNVHVAEDGTVRHVEFK